MGKSSKTTQSGTGNTTANPWQPTMPLLQDFLGQLSQAGGIGPTGAQTDAYNELKANASAGDPYAGQKGGLADWAYGQASDDGRIGQAYDAYNQGMSKYAAGDYLDVMNNPQMREMLDQAGGDAFNRVNAAFAGAGRSVTGSGGGQQAAARGVTQAQLPIMFDQFNKQQELQQQALGGMVGNAAAASGAQGQFGAMANQFGDAALNAQNYGAERMIDLEQQLKSMPYEDLGLMASLLFPAAGLGGKSKTQTTGMGKTKTGIFSDRRLKRNIKKVGQFDNGLTLYSYQYVGSDRVHVGAMADEVEVLHPDAVTEVMGMSMVDYGRATRKVPENA